jgi:hypothetical protein
VQRQPFRRNYEQLADNPPPAPSSPGDSQFEYVFPPRRRCPCGGMMNAASTRGIIRLTKCNKCGRTGKQVKVPLRPLR